MGLCDAMEGFANTTGPSYCVTGVYPVNTLHTLNSCNAVYQLYLNKALCALAVSDYVKAPLSPSIYASLL